MEGWGRYHRLVGVGSVASARIVVDAAFKVINL